MASTPGILYVTMQPNSDLSDSQFSDWYNNEHGPLRLRHPQFENGFRYRAVDGSKPEWMAIYDVSAMSCIFEEPYLRLRGPEVKTQREVETMSNITIDRKLFDLVRVTESPKWKKLEGVGADEGGNVLFAVISKVNEGKEDELRKWFDEEHIDLMSKVPGWLRSRSFKTSSLLEGKEETEFLTLHDYSLENGVGGPEYEKAVSTPWRNRIYADVIKSFDRRAYNLYYTFGPAPRDISNFSSDYTTIWTSIDGMTKTFPTPAHDGGVIESYITTPDNVAIPYRLEGSSDPNAPLILLSNPVLATWSIWDGFVSSFLSVSSNKKYRILRYNTRGRFSLPPSAEPVTIDLLASDIISLLDALRVPKAAALIGVSLGGATVLNAALKFPDRFTALVSCDTNAKSPDGNRKAWGDRIAISEKEGAVSTTGEGIVGDELAEMTTRRWFLKESYENPELEKKLLAVKEAVKNNSLEGFKKGVQALFQYDVREEMKTSKVKALFVVGSGDGVLPEVMNEMASSYGEKGAKYEVIKGAGHLPMVEKPGEFTDVVGKFLRV
ncbi:hypothetical protein B7494_g540 [Chlorociboria aeruginascens]|nr:hypothetical protein B7494_g540 [Chlorociboria aeruginascens]